MGVQIITRSGVPYTLSNLKKVAVWDADNVIVLQPQRCDEWLPQSATALCTTQSASVSLIQAPKKPSSSSEV